jgi:polar amino acid transport system permease protein
MSSDVTAVGKAAAREQIVWFALVSVAAVVLAYLARDLEWPTLWRYRAFLARGLATSIVLTVLAVAFGMVIGVLLASARLYGGEWLRWPAIVVIEVVRSVPQLLILLWVFFVVPELTGKKFTPETSALVALTIIAAAYLAEVIRGGLMSVDRIQFESGYATGLSRRAIFLSIVLPQAIRNMLPALLATWVMLFKTTTLAYVIGVLEFFQTATIVNQRELIPYTIYTLLAVVYFLCCYALSAIVRRLDPKYVLRSA